MCLLVHSLFTVYMQCVFEQVALGSVDFSVLAPEFAPRVYLVMCALLVVKHDMDLG